MKVRGTRALAMFTISGLLLVTPVWLAAQAPPREEAPLHAFTGTHLPVDHWAVNAARRAEALMLTDGYLPAQRAVPLEMVEMALRQAALRAPEMAPGLARTAGYWHGQLLAEFRGLDAATSAYEDVPFWIGLATSVGVEGRSGAAAPGLGEFEPHRSGALPLDDRVGGVLRQDARSALGRHIGLHYAPELATYGSRVNTLELSAGLGWFGASAGRIPIGYAHGQGGGVTLTGQVPLDGVQVGTRSPVLLPGAFSYLGPLTFQMVGAKMTEPRHPGDPYFWSASGQFQPHRRLTFGIHRAALFGGDPENHPVTLSNILNMLIGRVKGVGFEDQIVSVSGRLHLPTESVIPLTAYLEWGSEDAAGAWWAVPGRVMGLESPSLPFLPQAAAGIEFTHFDPRTTTNPEWYRHWSFHGSWASRDLTLGHPLGGHGYEFLVHAAADLDEPRLRISGRSFLRERGAENLFSPGRTGTSVGGAAEVAWRHTARSELRLSAAGEHGGDWTELRGGAHWTVFF